MFKEQRASRIGTRFNKYTCIKWVGNGRYLFKCDCGEERVHTWGRIASGSIIGCGKCSRTGRMVDPLAASRAVKWRYITSAKRRGYEWKLTDEQFFRMIAEPCWYCELPPSTDMKLKAHPEFRYTGIDRLENKVGYISSNCVPCCKNCNQSKHSMSQEEWYAWIRRIQNSSNLF